MTHDITHCCGQGCPLKETCLRYTGEVVGKQDFFTRLPYGLISLNCKYYLDDRPSEEKIRQLAYQLWETSDRQEDNSLTYWLAARKQLLDNLRNS
jgi:hypothetical protein